METNKGTSYFSIQPPKLEDAGLEDPALPIEGIQEAFRRVADSIQARTGVNVQVGTSSDRGMEDIVVDPLPEPDKGQCCAGGEIAEKIAPRDDVIVTPLEHLKGDLVSGGEEKGPKLGGRKCMLGETDPQEHVENM